MNVQGLRFPVGEFELPGPLDHDARARAVAGIRETPANLRSAVSDLEGPVSLSLDLLARLHERLRARKGWDR